MVNDVNITKEFEIIVPVVQNETKMTKLEKTDDISDNIELIKNNDDMENKSQNVERKVKVSIIKNKKYVKKTTIVLIVFSVITSIILLLIKKERNN